MKNTNYPLKGACQCGSVSYELLEPPMKVVACHCKECQKLSTSAFSITALVNKDSLRFKGEMSEWQRVAENGNVVAAKFCPTCSNRLYHYNPHADGPIKFKPSSLFNTSIIKPTMHIWVSEKQHWYSLPIDVLVHQRQPN
jgi:hypothetical protein